MQRNTVKNMPDYLKDEILCRVFHRKYGNSKSADSTHMQLAAKWTEGCDDKMCVRSRTSSKTTYHGCPLMLSQFLILHGSACGRCEGLRKPLQQQY